MGSPENQHSSENKESIAQTPQKLERLKSEITIQHQIEIEEMLTNLRKHISNDSESPEVLDQPATTNLPPETVSEKQITKTNTEIVTQKRPQKDDIVSVNGATNASHHTPVITQISDGFQKSGETLAHTIKTLFTDLAYLPSDIWHHFNTEKKQKK